MLAAEHVYLQADQRESPLQLESLATLLSRRLPDFDKVRYRTWDELLASLYARADRLIPVCLDEFPYLAQADPALPSLLQRYIDRADGQIAWILCGSSQRMMQGMVMDRKAPLYGRAREIIKVEPLSAGWLQRALALPSSEAVKAYATWGGVPRYWELAAEYDSQHEALQDLVWNPRGVLHEEPARLLLDDLRSAVQPYFGDCGPNGQTDFQPRSLSDWPHRGRRRRAGVLRWRNNNLGNKPIWGSAWRLIWDIIGAVKDSRRSIHGRRLSRA